MSQYKDGTISITNGGTTVTGINTLFLTSVGVGNVLRVNDGSEPVDYEVAVVTDNLTLQIPVPYAGPTVVSVPYTISRDFTTNHALPLVNPNDLQTAAIQNEAMNKLDALLSGSIAPISNHIANYNILASESSTLFKNVGATGAIEFFLPTAAAGLFYQFAVFESENIKVTASGGDEIINQSGSSFTSADESSNGGFLDIVAINADTWITRANVQNWSFT